MSQNDSNPHTIYRIAPIDKMLFTQCQYEGQLIPSILVTYADVRTRNIFVETVNEMRTSQQWSHELIITDSDVSIIFHCRGLSPPALLRLTSGLYVTLPGNMEIVFGCAANFDRETINLFRKNCDDTTTLLFQIVDSIDNIDDGKLTTTTLAEIILPIS